ncbi:MAG: choice-of-anchor J domain-containing protein, partial [Calditrichia bacterium]
MSMRCGTAFMVILCSLIFMSGFVLAKDELSYAQKLAIKQSESDSYVQKQKPIRSISKSAQLSEDFESGTWPPAGWTEYHTGVDTLVLTTLRANSPVNSANFADADLTDSSWLVTPQITALEAGSGVIFYENINFSSFYEYHGLWVSTGSGNPADGDFVEVDSLGASTEDVWEQRVVDLSAYDGQDVYIAWLYTGDFVDEWYIDDVSVEIPPVVLDYPFSEDMESGVWPPAGWTEYHTGVDTLVLTTLRANSPIYSANFADADLTDSSWFVSPLINNVGAGAELVFFENINFSSFYEKHALYVSTGSGNPADGDFVEVDSLAASTEDVWEANVRDFSAYEGQNIYIAWVYIGDFVDEWYIDDISLDAPSQVENNPPIGFVAEAAGFTADLSWNAPLPEPFLGYDDGTSEGTLSIGGGNDGELAVRFTPQIYPTTILEAQMLFGGVPAGSDTMQSTEVRIYDGDTAGPGTQLFSGNYPIVNRNVDFDNFDLSAGAVTISAGDFFVSVVEPVDSAIGLGSDIDSRDNLRSWVQSTTLGIAWDVIANVNAGLARNNILRVVVQEGSGPNARIRVLYSDGTSSKLSDVKERNLTGLATASLDVATFANPTELEKIEHLLGGVSHSKAGLPTPRTSALTGYNVYRSEDGVTFSQIAMTPDSVLSYTDANPPTNTTVTYYAAAQYTLNEGLASNTDSIFIGAAAPFPFTESWPDSGVIDPAKWGASANIAVIDTNGVSFNTFPFPVPSAPYFVSVNGSDQTLSTNPIDLSAQSSVTLSMQESEHDLEIGESVFLEYTDAGGNWLLLNEFIGTDNGFGLFEPFELVSFSLPADAYHAAFQFRFRSGATNATTDEWFFDDISLDVGSSSDET